MRNLLHMQEVSYILTLLDINKKSYLCWGPRPGRLFLVGRDRKKNFETREIRVWKTFKIRLNYSFSSNDGQSVDCSFLKLISIRDLFWYEKNDGSLYIIRCPFCKQFDFHSVNYNKFQIGFNEQVDLIKGARIFF